MILKNNWGDNGRDIIADCDDLFENNIGEDDYWINVSLSYLASSISVEAKYYFPAHLINFRHKNPKQQVQIIRLHVSKISSIRKLV